MRMDTLPATAIPAADEYMVARIREALRDRAVAAHGGAGGAPVASGCTADWRLL